MQTHILGYPRIGSKRELKKACEQYWSGKILLEELLNTGRNICNQNWNIQKEAGIDLIPCNDFSYYDQVLDMSLVVGAIPARYHEVVLKKNNSELDLYFAMARGYQKDGLDITAMEMTKWFDTNYHYIVPEFYKNQQFKLSSDKIFNEFAGAKQAGINAKPVIIGLVSYLLLGKEKEEGFDKLDLAANLLPVYIEILTKLQEQGAEWIQFDEPFLALDLTEKAKETYHFVYAEIRKRFPKLKFMVATYFEGLNDNGLLAVSLPVNVLHIDLVRNPEQLDDILNIVPESLSLSLGVVDGRNIWKNDFEKSLYFINKAIEKLGSERILIAPSSSLLHSPCDLDFETSLNPEIKNWLAFAKQKVTEVVTLKELVSGKENEQILASFEENKKAIASRKTSSLIHNDEVKQRANAVTEKDTQRINTFKIRKEEQQKVLQLPLFPTTTIGSFPQTTEVRSWRAKFKKGELTAEQYDTLLKEETQRTINWQEDIGIDVLVHGEFERNDMVEYFGEQLEGFVFTKNGWVQSYGSRCVKPPVIFGDVSRPTPMTVYWSQYAQSQTEKWVKGMLTGPVTILQWSFVRDDQPRSETCKQIALAIRDEVVDLEKAGIRIIQIDEPAIREGLPLRKTDWQNYLKWAVEAFRISASGVEDATQIHTHMCYSEFNDIIENIADMDADVITIECSRSQMELLNAFANFRYPNEIGPGVYDIHSPRVPSKEEMIELLRKAQNVIPANQLWVNPDCGLKTRHWEETEKALIAMVAAAKEASVEYAL
ncbi:5-methyltetrahydropteroyltriglutamate--homocysteine S-methyltransferase [Chryseobacterium viscerum]|uniref:5-methyltetrahydropteroyltriglutamate-- homocysteine S-methyltransferase n=1 Tax=Chryseobacterium viscerum TaxID=1037377 RepID=UPI0022213B44|nr:5-methyltetrahydropteroyltriglutamate--homocysteine S-methyltransferase [Chryseobacterium viscerum]MCW1962461.1 5-methyltetrahydropteroyltriglutamate--homocysteine S-methyltransferase [Chryseobacterium viscerum]